MAKKIVINQALSPRLQEATFSAVKSSQTLGPDLSQSTVQGESIQGSAVNNVTANQWVAMTQGDQELLNSIFDWINTTKEGVALVPDLLNGRNKKLIFNYYGTMGKSVKPGEIGQFEVNFFYTPSTGSETN